MTETSPDAYFCGGSILTRDKILTAAHCAENNFGPGVSLSMVVKARAHDLKKPDGETKHEICNSVTHPQWSGVTGDNDFKILTLCEPLMFDKSKEVRLSVSVSS